MSFNREVLEILALNTISAEHYYDLADNISDMENDELQALIDCKGNFRKELEYIGDEESLLELEMEKAENIKDMLRDSGISNG